MADTKYKYNMLLSYSRPDAKSVEKVAHYLSDAGLNIWFDQWSIVPGQSWKIALGRALSVFQKAIAINVCALESNRLNVASQLKNKATLLNNIEGVPKGLGDLQGTKKHYESPFEIFRKSLGEDHLYTATVRKDIGVLANVEGKSNEGRTEPENCMAEIESMAR